MKKSKNISKKRGFTLVEILVVIVISALVLAMVGGLLIFMANSSGTLIHKSEQLMLVQSIEKSMRGYAEDDISQLAYVELDEKKNIVFKGKTLFEETGLSYFMIYSETNDEQNPSRYFIKCKFQFPDDEPFDFILGIAGYIVQNTSPNNNHYNVPYDQENIDFNQLANSMYKSIILPNTLTSIPDNAFSNCSLLVNIPNSVKNIGQYAFRGCDKLAYVTIPNSVESIGVRAFYSCSNLINIKIDNSVTNIGYGAFDGCNSLASITYGGTVEQWQAITNGIRWTDNTIYTVFCIDGNIKADGTVTYK